DVCSSDLVPLQQRANGWVVLRYPARHGISKGEHAYISLRWQYCLHRRWQTRRRRFLVCGEVPRGFPWPPWIALQYRDVAHLPLLLYGCVLQVAKTKTLRQMASPSFGSKTPVRRRMWIVYPHYSKRSRQGIAGKPR